MFMVRPDAQNPVNGDLKSQHVILIFPWEFLNDLHLPFDLSHDDRLSSMGISYSAQDLAALPA